MDSVPTPAAKAKFAFFRKFLSKPYGIAFAGVLGVSVLSGAMFLLFAIMSGGGGEITFILAILAAILSYALVLLTPAISFGFSRGWKAGISVVAYEALWMVLIVIVAAYLLPTPEVMY